MLRCGASPLTISYRQSTSQETAHDQFGNLTNNTELRAHQLIGLICAIALN